MVAIVALRSGAEISIKEFPFMKRLFIAAVSTGLTLASGNAQIYSPTPGTTSPPAAGAPSASSPRAVGPGKAVRAQCRAQAKAQGLEGPARRAAVQECFAAARPDLAQAQKCRQEGKGKGLADGELRAFVRQCKGGG
jgi:hypothetical protein